MDRTFDIRRFGRYLAWDLRNARNNAGFSLLVYGVTPIFIFAFYQICSLVFNGGTSPFGLTPRLVCIFALIVLSAMMLPSRLYGRVTDRRYGTEFLLLPASTFEKFLSMVVIAGIVLPLCMSVLLLVSDSLLALCFPGLYGDALICMDNGVFFGLDALGGDDSVTFNFFLIMAMSWWTNLLVFILGAIFFKRSKVAKTILTYFLVSSVFGVAFSAIMLCASENPDAADMIGSMDDLQDLMSVLNWMVNIWYFLVSAVLLGLIYLRLRTIKH